MDKLIIENKKMRGSWVTWGTYNTFDCSAIGWSFLSIYQTDQLENKASPRNDIRKSFKYSFRWYMNAAIKMLRLENNRAGARTLIGGGVYIHIFGLCPTNFFWNQLYYKQLYYYSGRTWIYEYTPPPPISVLAPALENKESRTWKYWTCW